MSLRDISKMAAVMDTIVYNDGEFEYLFIRELSEIAEKLPSREDRNKVDFLIGALQLYLRTKRGATK